MYAYLYLIIVSIAIICMIFEEIYLFSKGKYYPYFAWNKEDNIKKRIFDIGLLVVAWFCSNNLIYIHKPEIAICIMLFLMFILAITMSILHYLSYKKVQELKILYQTIIFDIFVIAFYVYIYFMELQNHKTI